MYALEYMLFKYLYAQLKKVNDFVVLCHQLYLNVKVKQLLDSLQLMKLRDNIIWYIWKAKMHGALIMNYGNQMKLSQKHFFKKFNKLKESMHSCHYACNFTKPTISSP